MGEVITRIEERIGYVSFNLPETRNAVYPGLLDEVIAAIEAMDSDESVRVIVLGGEGEAFCAGADHKKFLVTLKGKTPKEIQTDIYRRFMGLARALKLAQKPTIAAVQGGAVGAGCEFAVACDFRIAATNAMFWENWINFGIIPPLGGAFLLPKLIGAERAANMIMRAQRVSAEEALSWGLVSEVVAPEQLAEAVHNFALSLAKRSPQAMAVAKQILRRGAESSLAAEWEFNVQAQSILLTAEDFVEVLDNMAKRSEGA